MKTQKGFGLIGILITLAIIVGIAGTTFYTLQNVGQVDTLDGENETQSINSVIQQAEDVKRQIEKRNVKIQDQIFTEENAESPTAQETETTPASPPISEPTPSPEPTGESAPEPDPGSVPPPPPSVPNCTLSISPNTIIEGENATLSWGSTDADSGSVNEGVGTITPVLSGSQSVSPTAGTTYTATFTGEGGTVQCSTSITVNAPPPPPPPPQTVTVTYTNNGFNLATLTINQGDTVLFVNNSTHSMWIGSDPHPTHVGYPESTPSDCFGSAFDSCTNIASGNSWSFTFNSIGSWEYHNHTRVGKTGRVIVQ